MFYMGTLALPPLIAFVALGVAGMRVLYLIGIPDELERAIIGSVIVIGVTVDELVHR